MALKSTLSETLKSIYSLSKADSTFSLKGALLGAPQKKFKETIFFVHFYEGNWRLLSKHIDFVHKLGFDAYAFNLENNFTLTKLPISKSGAFGIKHYYADQIEAHLNSLEGKKIIYSFSNPTASAFEALSRRRCHDIVGLIADSGPSARFIKSVFNLWTKDKNFSIWPIRALASPLFSLVWSRSLHHDLKYDLEKFPKNFPILSIRGWKDHLISPTDIDLVFEPHSHLDWQRLALPQAGHLNGLRDFPDQYKPAVEKFLKTIAHILD